VVPIPEAGHFVQTDAADEVNALPAEFLTVEDRQSCLSGQTGLSVLHRSP